MSETESPRLPFHLRGNYAPVAEERTETALRVEGAIPPELAGVFLRNGPNPAGGRSAHWFFGDGMVHGLRLEDGSAAWYRNRWVRTRSLSEKTTLISPAGDVDLSAGPANTGLVAHGGRILALVESAWPWEIDANLETVGCHTFEGRLTTAMTAHPKVCPSTGEMHFFGYGFSEPWLTYHVADRDGRLVRSSVIPVAGPTMIHDFALTERHAIFMDLPVVFDLERAMAGTMPYRWSDEYGARVGLLPRGAGVEELRWYEVEPCYVFHPLNAFESGDETVVDVARYDEYWREGSSTFPPARLHRWTFDRERLEVRETALDDHGIEFPRIRDDLVGLPHRYGYAAWNNIERNNDFGGLVKFDLARGTTTERDLGPGMFPGEAVFAPRAAPTEGTEDDGWLLTFVYDAVENRSHLLVLAANDFAGEPVARVHLPTRVPFGFHGIWKPDASPEAPL
jgi:carotenoid cleavage dioxygenase-like enzyme